MKRSNKPKMMTPDGWALTEHARVRCHERAIPSTAIDLIVAYGREKRVRGASRFFLDKPSRHRIKRDLGPEVYGRLKRHLRITVVQADGGTLITTFWRPRRRRLAVRARQ